MDVAAADERGVVIRPDLQCRRVVADRLRKVVHPAIDQRTVRIRLVEAGVELDRPVEVRQRLAEPTGAAVGGAAHIVG